MNMFSDLPLYVIYIALLRDNALLLGGIVVVSIAASAFLIARYRLPLVRTVGLVALLVPALGILFYSFSEGDHLFAFGAGLIFLGIPLSLIFMLVVGLARVFLRKRP